MPKENYRLVVLSKDTAQVFNGNICVAAFKITDTSEITAGVIEEIRTADYEEPKGACDV